MTSPEGKISFHCSRREANRFFDRRSAADVGVTYLDPA